MPYVTTALPAYIGCVGKIAKDLLKANPSLIPATSLVSSTLGDVVPTIDSLFHEEPTPPPDIPAPARSGKVETLQQRLTRKVFEKIHEDMVQQAIIQVTSSATCSDFLLPG
jgi:hypothetical protein